MTITGLVNGTQYSFIVTALNRYRESVASVVTTAAPGTAIALQAQWAQTLTAGSGPNYYYGVAIDISGNLYAAGAVFGASAYSFGNGVSASGSSGSYNTLLVKCNSSGLARWAQTLTAGSGGSAEAEFYGLAVDGSGNVYAAGFSYGTTTYGFGNGVSATGTSSGANVLLVKYNSAGQAQWAQTLASGGSGNQIGFQSVAVDGSGNVYAAGIIEGTGSYGFGNSISAAGSASNNVVLVKYNSSGAARWAQTFTSGTNVGAVPYYYGVAVDGSGNVYAAGSIAGTTSYGFGNGVTATGTAGGNNALLVKYNSSGQAQWAQTLTAGSGFSDYAVFQGLAVDGSGNVYAVGTAGGTTTYGFGNGVTATGLTTSDNALTVKYNSAGVAQWAQTLTAASSSGAAFFNGVAVDASGNIYAAGLPRGNDIVRIWQRCDCNRTHNQRKRIAGEL